MNYYGLFISLGILIAGLTAEKLRKKLSLDKKYSFFEVFPWLIIPAVIGARIYHLIDFWEYYQQFPERIFAFWQGGLGILGGLFAGALGLFVYAKLKNLQVEEMLALFDLAAFVLPLGQAVGRLGNYFNQELYGIETNLPWAITIAGSQHHPLFAYQALWNFLLFLIFLQFFSPWKRENHQPGDLFFAYLFLYSFGRFWLDFLRVRSWKLLLPIINQQVRTSQLICLLLMVTSSLYFLINRFVLVHKQFGKKEKKQS